MTRARPNILIIMVDQLTGTLFPDGPAPFLHAPHLKALAARSACFINSYTPSPLCAPSRASFMSGLLPSRTRVYDNAAEFAASIPTFAHHLRRSGGSEELAASAGRGTGGTARLGGLIERDFALHVAGADGLHLGGVFAAHRRQGHAAGD